MYKFPSDPTLRSNKAVIHSIRSLGYGEYLGILSRSPDNYLRTDGYLLYVFNKAIARMGVYHNTNYDVLTNFIDLMEYGIYIKNLDQVTYYESKREKSLVFLPQGRNMTRNNLIPINLDERNRLDQLYYKIVGYYPEEEVDGFIGI